MLNSKVKKLATLFALALSAGPLLMLPTPPAQAAVSVAIGVPGISLGINVPSYPDLVPVPGYPVYYAPDLGMNYFFYDGLYWVFVGDQWYVSSWYDGPWQLIDPDDVPVFLLRIPVEYYRVPPPYFHGWRADAPPHWGERWGHDWASRHGGWQRWDRHAAPPPAPLPSYQRSFSGERYPREFQQQHSIRSEHYHFQPREPQIHQRFQPPAAQQVAPQMRPGMEPQRNGQRPDEREHERHD